MPRRYKRQSYKISNNTTSTQPQPISLTIHITQPFKPFTTSSVTSINHSYINQLETCGNCMWGRMPDEGCDCLRGKLDPSRNIHICKIRWGEQSSFYPSLFAFGSVLYMLLSGGTNQPKRTTCG